MTRDIMLPLALGEGFSFSEDSVADIEDNRWLWKATSKVADLAGAWQAALALAPVAAIVASRWIHWFNTGAVAGSIVTGLAVTSGAAGGVLVVHPYASRLLIRRQTEYEIIRFDVFGKFEAGSRVPVSWRQDRTIRALREGVSDVQLFFGYGGSSDQVNIHVTKGGRLLRRYDLDGRWFIDVRLDRALKKGQTHVISTKLVVPPDAPDCPPFCTVTPQTLMSNVTIKVDFDGSHPHCVWSTYWISDVATIKCLTRLVSPGADGSYTERLRRTKPGHRYGLTWEWD